MLLIKELKKNMRSEINDAYNYAILALKYKDTEEYCANLFYELANEELCHFNKLHKAVERIINEYKKDKDVPDDMLAIYNYLHDIEIEDINETKMLLASYE